MATVSSLDHDMRKLRMSRYTPGAERETREWIERTLGEKLPPGDLIAALKDGTVLCKLINHVSSSNPIRFKKSNLPFVQMENISHFLCACENPPFNLPGHDRFLTVDLYEGKDPAQVLQCLGAFSRVANAFNSHKVPTTIGPQSELVRTATIAANDPRGSVRASKYGTVRRAITGSSGDVLTPNVTGGSSSSRATDMGRPASSLGNWSSRGTGGEAPAWNYIQYGSMQGANQGNQGLVFGGRRQIVDPSSVTPTPSRHSKKSSETEEEARRRTRMQQLEEEDQRAQAEVNRKREQLDRVRQEEFEKLEQQKREWERQEQEWNAREQTRLEEERNAEKKYREEQERRRKELASLSLNGQKLSEYQEKAEKLSSSAAVELKKPAPGHDRVAQLEKQLAEAKERERLYLLEREQRRGTSSCASSIRSRSPSRTEWPAERDTSPKASEVSWAAGEERLYTRHDPAPVPEEEEEEEEEKETVEDVKTSFQPLPTRPLFQSRPLPNPATAMSPPTPSARPLPDPMSSPTTPRPTAVVAKPFASPVSTPSATPTGPLSSRPLPLPKASSASSPPFKSGPVVTMASPTAGSIVVPKVVGSRPLPKPTIRKSSQTVKTDLLSQPPRLVPKPTEPEPAPVSAPSPRLHPAPLSPSRNQPLPPRPSSSLLGSRPLPRPAFGSIRRSPFARAPVENVNGPAPVQPAQAPVQSGARVPSVHLSREMQLSSAAEQENEAERRRVAQQKANAANMASKSLLQREMERERERLCEWEQEQQRKGQMGHQKQQPSSPARTTTSSVVGSSPTRSPSRLTGLRSGLSSPSRIGERGPSPFARSLTGPRPGP